VRHERRALADRRAVGTAHAAPPRSSPRPACTKASATVVDAVLAEEGLTVGEASRDRWRSRGRLFDLIVTLAPEAHHAALELTRSLAVDVEYWSMPDPTDVGGRREQIMTAYRDVRERLKAV